MTGFALDCMSWSFSSAASWFQLVSKKPFVASEDSKMCFETTHEFVSADLTHGSCTCLIQHECLSVSLGCLEAGVWRLKSELGVRIHSISLRYFRGIFSHTTGNLLYLSIFSFYKSFSSTDSMISHWQADKSKLKTVSFINCADLNSVITSANNGCFDPLGVEYQIFLRAVQKWILHSMWVVLDPTLCNKGGENCCLLQNGAVWIHWIFI